ncbi:MAG: hypothetical protein WC895_02745 [Candidatus Shapirobacteria bacterium]|jgi:hypothetical protein
MTIKEARKLIRKINIQYSDVEILEMIDTAKFFKDIAMDMFSKMTPKEMKKIR